MNKQKTPFMVSALLVIGAWLSSFIFMGLFIMPSWKQWLWAAVVFLVLAAVLQFSGQKKFRGLLADFVSQASVPFSLCGKCLLVLAVGDMLGTHVTLFGSHEWLVWFCITAVVTAFSYPVFTHSADRVFSVLVCVLTLFLYFGDVFYAPWQLQLAAAVVFGISYALFIWKKESFQPLAWGLLGAVPASFFFYADEASVWYVKLILAAVLCAVYIFSQRRQSHWIVCVLIFWVLYATNIGAGMGLALLALGYAQQRLALKIWGAGTFALSLFWLYFAMDISLLAKSGYLCLAGLVLLGVYAGLKKGGIYAR